eukprot:673268-Pyramimonas_sp.AAC.1
MWRTVLSTMAWGTSMLQLERQVRQMLAGAHLTDRLLTAFDADWTQNPPTGSRNPTGRRILSQNAALTADAACALTHA